MTGNQEGVIFSHLRKKVMPLGCYGVDFWSAPGWPGLETRGRKSCICSGLDQQQASRPARLALLLDAGLGLSVLNVAGSSVLCMLQDST